MATLNNRDYPDWRSYINDKFSDPDFVIIDNTGDPDPVIVIRSATNNSLTSILFDLPTADLCRVTFYNPDSPLHNTENDKERARSLFFSDYGLNDENLKNVDEYLDIPLYFGWTEEAVYYKGELVIAEARYFGRNSWNHIWSNSNLSWSEKTGCLINLLAWPVFIPQHKYIYKRLNSAEREKKVVLTNIPPMLQSDQV